jgi:hypothetical protein
MVCAWYNKVLWPPVLNESASVGWLTKEPGAAAGGQFLAV